MQNIQSVASTTVWLLWREVRILRKNMLDSFIDSLIIPCSFIIIGGYILPHLGMPSDYGAFMAVSSAIMMCYGTSCWIGAGPLVADLESDRSITYELVLPLPSWLLTIKMAIGFAVHAFILNLLTLPVGKLLLMDKFDMSQLSVFKFVFSYFNACLLFSFFAIVIAFWVKDSYAFGRFWMRVGSQLMFFSGLQFSWYVLRQAWPTFAYLDLLNPLIYAVEGTRAAVLGQEGSLHYWSCQGMMWLWIVIFACLAHALMKKRLDCV